MPSPLAHASLALLAAACFDGRGGCGESERHLDTDPRDTGTKGPSRLRAAAWFSVLALMPLLLPDADLLLALVLGRPLGQLHGTFMHSLVFGSVFALVFAGFATRPFVRRKYARSNGCHGFRFWFFLAVTAWWTHLLMDSATHGRGVMLWWPIDTERVRLPLTIFVGAEYSNWRDTSAHLATLINEGLFALIVSAASWSLWRKLRRAKAVKP